MCPICPNKLLVALWNLCQEAEIYFSLFETMMSCADTEQMVFSASWVEGATSVQLKAWRDAYSSKQIKKKNSATYSKKFTVHLDTYIWSLDSLIYSKNGNLELNEKLMQCYEVSAKWSVFKLTGFILPQSPVQHFSLHKLRLYILQGKNIHAQHQQLARRFFLPYILQGASSSSPGREAAAGPLLSLTCERRWPRSIVHSSWVGINHDAWMIDRQSNNTRSKNNFSRSILDLTERAVSLVKSRGYHIKMDFCLLDQSQWKYLN